MTMEWAPGQFYPLDGTGRLQRGECAPVWYALTTPPQKEAAARAFLEKRGIHAFYPNERRFSTLWGKKRVRKHPIVSGYVFARFTGIPQWHVIRARPFFSGVVSLGVRPFAIPRPTIKRLQGLTVEAEERRRELREIQEQLRLARMPVQGEKARIMEGPLEGFLVDVTGLSGGVVRFLLPGGFKGEARAEWLEREDP